MRRLVGRCGLFWWVAVVGAGVTAPSNLANDVRKMADVACNSASSWKGRSRVQRGSQWLVRVIEGGWGRF